MTKKTCIGDSYVTRNYYRNYSILVNCYGSNFDKCCNDCLTHNCWKKTTIIISLFLALGLRLIPDKWLLGLLGFIPLVFGFIALFRGPEDLDDINKGNDTTSSRKIMWTMFILAITSCAPDNIGLFTPYFANLQTTFIPVVTIVFLINVLFMGLFTDFVSRVTSLQNFLFKYSGILVAVTYIVLGLMIIIESDTLQHIGKLIFR